MKNLQVRQWQIMMVPEDLPLMTWMGLLQVPQTHLVKKKIEGIKNKKES